MLLFLLKRLATLVITLAVASAVVFVVLDLLPGNAAEVILGETATPESLAARYLGLGTQPPQPSWGRMLNEAQTEAQTQIFQAPLLAGYPGLAIMLSVLGLNLVGDGLRDLMDPKLTRRR